jgi:hypothetical protein
MQTHILAGFLRQSFDKPLYAVAKQVAEIAKDMADNETKDHNRSKCHREECVI